MNVLGWFVVQEKVGVRIDSVENALQSELNALEAKLVNTTTNAVKQWEEK
jgi:hypothetical protein